MIVTESTIFGEKNKTELKKAGHELRVTGLRGELFQFEQSQLPG